MAVTPVWLLPYPSDTTVADVPADLKDLAERIEDLVTPLDAAITAINDRHSDDIGNNAIRFGSVSFTTSAAVTNRTGLIGFGGAFSSAPRVTLGVVTGTAELVPVTVAVTDKTTGSFRINVRNQGASTYSGTIDWIAIGPRSA